MKRIHDDNEIKDQAIYIVNETKEPTVEIHEQYANVLAPLNELPSYTHNDDKQPVEETLEQTVEQTLEIDKQYANVLGPSNRHCFCFHTTLYNITLPNKKTTLSKEFKNELLSLSKYSDIKTINIKDLSLAGTHIMFYAVKNNKPLVLNIYIKETNEKAVKLLKTSLHIASLTLEKLSVNFDFQKSSKFISEIIKTLYSTSTIIELDLSQNKIDNDCVEPIAKLLEINKSIKTFNLSNNKISYRGFKKILEALTINSTLTSLDLSNNEILWTPIETIPDDNEIINTLNSFTHKNKSLKKLKIEISSSAGKLDLVNNILCFSEAIKELDISNTGYCAPSHYKRKTPLLSISSSISILNLSGCYSNYKNFVEDLSRTLRTGTPNLKELGLTNNRITNKDLNLLVPALINCKKLEKLDLSRNNINVYPDGARRIIDLFKNTTMKVHVNLSFNLIRSFYIRQFIIELNSRAAQKHLPMFNKQYCPTEHCCYLKFSGNISIIMPEHKNSILEFAGGYNTEPLVIGKN